MNAALLERLGGLAYYDTDASLSWMTNANAAIGSAYESWHWIYDLRRITEIVTLLLDNEDFCKIEKDKLCTDPQEFLTEIISALKNTKG